MPSLGASLQLQTMSVAALPGAVATRKLCDFCPCCGRPAFSGVCSEPDSSAAKQSASAAEARVWAHGTCSV